MVLKLVALEPAVIFTAGEVEHVCMAVPAMAVGAAVIVTFAVVGYIAQPADAAIVYVTV